MKIRKVFEIQMRLEGKRFLARISFMKDKNWQKLKFSMALLKKLIRLTSCQVNRLNVPNLQTRN